MSTETSVQPQVNEARKRQNVFLLNRNFAFLAIGQAISNFGDVVYSTTLLIWAFVLTHQASAVSGILIAQYIPTFVLGPLAGVFVDRWNRRTTMVVTDLFRLVVTMLPLFPPGDLRLPALYASVFLLSSFSRFFTPARAGITQVIVAREQQAQAASISQATFALSLVLGPALTSPLFFTVGPFLACLINAASFLASALCLLALRVPSALVHPSKSAGKSGLQTVISELLAGFRQIAVTRVLLVVVGMGLIALFGGGAITALNIVFVNQRLHASVSLYGPLAAISGLGIVVGAVLAGILATKVTPKTLLAGSVFLLGLGYIVYALQIWYAVALVLFFLLPLPNGGVEVGFAPLLFRATPPAMMGRVQAAIETAMFGTSLVSIGLAGLLGRFIPVSLIFVGSGACIALAGLFGWFALPASEDSGGMTTPTNK